MYQNLFLIFVEIIDFEPLLNDNLLNYISNHYSVSYDT